MSLARARDRRSSATSRSPRVLLLHRRGVVLVVSFVLLGRPLAASAARGARRRAAARRASSSACSSRAPCGSSSARSSVGLLALTLATALFGTTIELLNFAPTFVYVIFWLGLPLLSVLFGNVWSVLSPWRAIADATVWVLERGGREARPCSSGRGAGAATRLRLRSSPSSRSSSRTRGPLPAHARRSRSRSTLLGARRDGRLRARRVDAVRRGLRGRVRASRADRAVRSPRRLGRRPLAVHRARRRRARPGHARVRRASCSARRASTGSAARAPGRTCSPTCAPSLADSSPARRSTSRRRSLNLGGLALFIVVVPGHVPRGGRGRAVARAASTARSSPTSSSRSSRSPRRTSFAHYFTLFLDPGQFIIPLASDPFGRGWDLFGTADYAPNLAIVTPETVWYVQVAALVVGHVAGLAIAHDRAVALFEERRRALEAQYRCSALMVALHGRRDVAALAWASRARRPRGRDRRGVDRARAWSPSSSGCGCGSAGPTARTSSGSATGEESPPG